MKPFYSFILMIVCIFINAQSTKPVLDIAQRNVAWLVPYLDLKIIKSEVDEFHIEKKNNKILISANNNNTLARGLGHYLRFVAHRSISHLGDNTQKPKKIVFPTDKISVKSSFQYRYALNYCTLSYSMSFYTWADWQKELDWMAMNGVNLLLMPLGTEVVWLKTLQKIGYTEEEAKRYIATPTFSAWWQMGNLEGWHGTITNAVIEEQRQLAHKVFARMNELGITPIYQGFYGNVPTSLKTKFPVKVVEQGLWAGGFQRPDMLHPNDDFFPKMAEIYYNEIKKEYGDFLFFGGDPFHEGGRADGINIAEAGFQIQKEMRKVFPKSSWVLQGWGHNPSKELLSRLDEKHTLILELEGENTANWEQQKAYGGKSFIWCQISNFGAKTGLYGKVQRFADEVYRLQNSQYSSFAKGIGIIPEGIHNNPLVYDLTLDLAWQKEKINTEDWIKKYILYRYGKTNPQLEQAWKILLKTAYKSHTNAQQGAPESMLCARPSLGLKSVSSWGTTYRAYEVEDLKNAVKLMLSVEKDFKHSETFQADKIDLLRQINSDKSLILYNEIQKNIKEKDLKKFLINQKLFLELIALQDQLLSVNKHFRLHTFLKQAENSSKDKTSKELAIKNAKVQITYWGTDTNKTTNLRDYAHKEWSGILGSLYYQRWQAFFMEQEAILKGENPPSPDYYQMEKDWTMSQELYEPISISEKKFNQLVDKTLR